MLAPISWTHEPWASLTNEHEQSFHEPEAWGYRPSPAVLSQPDTLESLSGWPIEPASADRHHPQQFDQQLQRRAEHLHVRHFHS